MSATVNNSERRRKVMEKNYTPEESVRLCKAWAAISEDLSVGTDQRMERFWSRISEEFIKLTPPDSDLPIRSPRSLQSKWADIVHDVSKFIGMYVGIVDAKPSGYSLEDIYQAACTQFTTITGKKLFSYRDCFEYLHKHPKFQAGKPPSSTTSSSKRKLPDINDLDPAAEEPSESPYRPQGIKAAKLQKSVTQLSTSPLSQLAAATSCLVAAQNAKAEAIRDFVELSFMLHAKGTPIFDQFMKLKQLSILDRMKKQLGSSVSDSSSEATVLSFTSDSSTTTSSTSSTSSQSSLGSEFHYPFSSSSESLIDFPLNQPILLSDSELPDCDDIILSNQQDDDFDGSEQNNIE